MSKFRQMSNIKKYGVCDFSIVPVRKNPTSTSELVTQLIFGELYTITNKSEKWSYIKIQDDLYNGWINNSQINIISKNDFDKLKLIKPRLSLEVIGHIFNNTGKTLIPIGSLINSCEYLNYTFQGKSSDQVNNDLIKIAIKYINSPYLWGGKSPLGIDCSGFTQMVYKINGINIKRDASQQAIQGKLIRKKELKPGDLAFFGESEKSITHVGIMLNKSKIIHAFGKVQINEVNADGIYNSIDKKITHKLVYFRSY